MEASYFMMCGDPKDISELQEAITKLLCKIILGKEDDFVRAEVLIDIQDHPDYYCATFENTGLERAPSLQELVARAMELSRQDWMGQTTC